MNKLVKIGIFYDGNYFAHVSNYYNYIHPRKARINILGLHEFIRKTVASYEEIDPCYAQIVDAHYFRGRYFAQESQKSNKLMSERQFDDILMTSGIVTHYLPLASHGEKGIDVWYSLEAYELTVNKQFDVVVLIACDGDYLPLVRKLNTLGARVMILGWEFEYADHSGKQVVTSVSQQLLSEVSYPVEMRQLIDERLRANDTSIESLFVRKYNSQRPRQDHADKHDKGTTLISDDELSGTIQALKEGYGFIRPDDGTPNIFFYFGEIAEGHEASDLAQDMRVSYKRGTNSRGMCALQIRPLTDDEEPYDF